MSRVFRVLDAGLRAGRLNIALDQAMLELHQTGRLADSVRFIHFQPSALLGRHQSLSAEIDVDYCRQRGIEVGRRITGGGAIYLDPGQLGWALVFGRGALGGPSLDEMARAVCEAAAAGLSRFGIEVRFRPRNDLEVEGRKLGGTGGFFDGDTLLYQGTVLVELDTTSLLGALRVPRAKIVRHGLDSAAQRVVSLRELLGARTPTIGQVQQALLDGFCERLGIEFQPAEADSHAAVLQLGRELHARWIGTEEFVAEIDGPPRGAAVSVGTCAGAGGTITAYLRREGPEGRRIGQVLISGDFFVAPPRLVLDLESRLRGIEIESVGETIERFFLEHPASTLSVGAADFKRAIETALSATAHAPA
jgi:lipoate-protein ligase A